MKDPFDILRAELVEAAERAALPAPHKRWRRLRRPSHPVAVLLAALVIAGAAGARSSRSPGAPHSRLRGVCRERLPPRRWRATATRSQCSPRWGPGRRDGSR